MFDRFTERARAAIVAAQEESHGLKHGYIGTEHLLLGLLADDEGIASNVLQGYGLTLENARAEIVRLVGKGNNENIRGQSPFTPMSKKVLELALKEALSLGHNYIGTEHLLLALVREDQQGVAMKVMTGHGITPEQVRKDVIRSLSGGETVGVGVKSGRRPGSRPVGKNRVLEQYSRNLTALAEDEKLDPCVGREREIERLMQILARRQKNNPILVGDPGVGKTSVVEGLAQRIVNEQVPEMLRDIQLYSLDLGLLVAGTKFRGEFEERLKKVIKEAADKNVVLFIDEIHSIVGAGSAEGALDAGSLLKPSLARGEIRIIGATTLDEFRKHFERDSALERRFQPVKVGEPSIEETVAILQGLRDRYEAHHRVQYSDEALRAAAELADRYIQDRFLPDKAIDLIDEAGARAALYRTRTSPLIQKLEAELEALEAEKNMEIDRQAFEAAASLRDRIREIEEELREARRQALEGDGEVQKVDAAAIADVVSMWSGVPVSQLTEAETARLLHMEEDLQARVIGQADAVHAVSRAIRRARAGIKDPRRPAGSFIFLGPTGVGKTELARSLAEFLFGNKDRLIQLDMSEYQEKHTVSRLVGAPPGYIGHDEGGQLTELVRRNPYSVVLFDEVEKAHHDVTNVLLQILEDGTLTDSQGRKVDFRNAIIILTSNLGANEIVKPFQLGFSGDDDPESRRASMRSRALSSLKKAFRPELLNRIDEVIVFNKLSREDVLGIADLLLANARRQVESKGLTLEISEAAKNLLVERGYDESMGARPLRRVIQRLVEDEIADLVLRGDIAPGGQIVVDLRPDPEDEEPPLQATYLPGDGASDAVEVADEALAPLTTS